MAEETKPTEEAKKQPEVQAALPVAAEKIEQPEVKPEVKVEAHKEEKRELPKGVYTELYKLREERRKLRDELELKNKALESTKGMTTNAAKEETVDILENPEGRLAVERERIKAEVLSAVRGEQAEAARIAKVQEEGSKAIEYLYTRPEIAGMSDKIEEVDMIIKSDPRLSEVVRIAPMLAAKEAYEAWKAHKGIDEGSKVAAASGLAAIASAKSTPTLNTAGRTLSDVKADLAGLHPSVPDFQKKYDALTQEYLSLVRR